MTQTISASEQEVASEILEKFLNAFANSGKKRKIRVQFKFKNSNVGLEEWLTYKQYENLKTFDCLELCNISPSEIQST